MEHYDEESHSKWLEACARLNESIQSLGIAAENARAAALALNFIRNEWPDTVYEDILDAEVVEL